MNTETTEIGAHSLAEVKLFAGLPADSLAAVEAQCRWVSIAPNESVMAIADDSTDVYCVVFGKVRVVTSRDDGSEVLLAELGVGDTFGELSAFNSARRSARVIGDEPCAFPDRPPAWPNHGLNWEMRVNKPYEREPPLHSIF